MISYSFIRFFLNFYLNNQLSFFQNMLLF